MKKKLLAILFVAMVAMLTFAVSASAATSTGTTGACTYTFDDETGVLTISGNGAPARIDSIARQKAVSVVFEEGVTAVPDNFCLGNALLQSVTIPSSVTSIGANAFRNCAALVNFDIAEGTQVATIGANAFNSSAIGAVKFNDNLTSVGATAFYYCHSLTEADLGNGLTTLGNEIFNHCINLTKVNMGGTYTTLPTKTFIQCYKLADVTIADSVTAIGAYAFMQTPALASVEMPSGLVSIGNSGFKNSGVTNVELPSTVTTLGEQAFINCASLKTITLSDNLSSIGNYCFAASGLTEVTIPDSLTAIPVKAFFNCKALATVNMNDTLVTLKGYAFAGSGVTSIVLPATANDLATGGFYQCESLVSAQINSNTNIIPDKFFMLCTALTTANIPESVVNVQPQSFSGCTKLQSITLPAGLKLLQKQAFNNTPMLAVAINVPGTVANIGDACFYRSGITSVTFGEGVVTIGNEAFRQTAIEGVVTIPATVTTIGNGAFRQAKVTEANLPASITSMGDKYVFYANPAKVVLHIADDATYVKEWAATATNVTIGDAYIPGGDVEPEFEGVKLNVVVDGTTATATLVLENAPELTSVAFNIAFTADDLTLTAATTALDGYTTNPAIANPVKFVWIDGLENVNINGTIATFTFTVAEGAEITAEDFAITYDADDVCALNDANELVNVELATIVVIG